MKILQQNKLFNVVGGYIIVWILLVSIDVGVTALKDVYYESQDSTYWAEYIDVKPAAAAFSINERPQFISVTIQRRPTAFKWNDILRCDLKGGYNYGHYIDYQSESKGNAEPSDEVTVSQPWFYGDADYISPPAGSRCFLESQIEICPPELEGECRLQIFKGDSFTFHD